jgi:hypothetical protein
MDICYSITIIINTPGFLYFDKITKINVFPIYLFKNKLVMYICLMMAFHKPKHVAEHY